MQWPSWEIGRALGIPIRVHASWFLVFFFVTSTLATGYLPESLPGLSVQRYWAMGGMAAVLLFLSVLLHELGHSYVALRYRIPIGQITLFLFGGVAQMRSEPPHPKAEFLIAIAGPAVSFLLGGLCIGFVLAVESLANPSGWQGLLVLSALLGIVNVNLGLFNLLPGFPLDGGRVLRAGLWAWGKDFYRATRQAAMVGLSFGALFGLIGVLVILFAAQGTLPGAMASNGGWIALLGIFLFSTALASKRHAALRQSLAGTPVRDLMVRTVVTLSPELSVHEAVTHYFTPYGYGGFPVVADGRLVGLIRVADVQTVPASLWAWRSVGQVMRPFSPALLIAAESPAMQALERMTQEGLDRLVVVEGDEIVGLVTHSAIARFLQLRREVSH